MATFGYNLIFPRLLGCEQGYGHVQSQPSSAIGQSLFRGVAFVPKIGMPAPISFHNHIATIVISPGNCSFFGGLSSSYSESGHTSRNLARDPLRNSHETPS